MNGAYASEPPTEPPDGWTWVTDPTHRLELHPTEDTAFRIIVECDESTHVTSVFLEYELSIDGYRTDAVLDSFSDIGTGAETITQLLDDAIQSASGYSLEGVTTVETAMGLDFIAIGYPDVHDDISLSESAIDELVAGLYGDEVDHAGTQIQTVDSESAERYSLDVHVFAKTEPQYECLNDSP